MRSQVSVQVTISFQKQEVGSNYVIGQIRMGKATNNFTSRPSLQSHQVPRAACPMIMPSATSTTKGMSVLSFKYRLTSCHPPPSPLLSGSHSNYYCTLLRNSPLVLSLLICSSSSSQ